MNTTDYGMSYMNTSLPAKVVPKTKRKLRKRNAFKNTQHLNLEHREKERIRHQTINEEIERLCQLLPKKEGKQTKVQRLQRVLSYCCYLESTVEKLSKELEITIPRRYKLITSQSLNDACCEEIENRGNEVTAKDYREGNALDSSVAYPFSYVNSVGWSDHLVQSGSLLNATSDFQWCVLPNTVPEAESLEPQIPTESQ